MFQNLAQVSICLVGWKQLLVLLQLNLVLYSLFSQIPCHFDYFWRYSKLLGGLLVILALGEDHLISWSPLVLFLGLVVHVDLVRCLEWMSRWLLMPKLCLSSEDRVSKYLLFFLGGCLRTCGWFLCKKWTLDLQEASSVSSVQNIPSYCDDPYAILVWCHAKWAVFLRTSSIPWLYLEKTALVPLLSVSKPIFESGVFMGIDPHWHPTIRRTSLMEAHLLFPLIFQGFYRYFSVGETSYFILALCFMM